MHKIAERMQRVKEKRLLECVMRQAAFEKGIVNGGTRLLFDTGEFKK